MRSRDEIKSFVLFQMHRNIVNLYKKYIVITEDLRNEHLKFLHKLEETNPRDSLQKIEYFDDFKYNYIRKKILDAGNDVIRDLERNFEMIEVGISPEYLEKAALDNDIINNLNNRKKEDYEKLKDSL